MEFTELVDLASERFGGRVLAANDDFFAPKENLLKSAAPIFLADKFTDRGKWMDGWETRRRRGPGHDWAIVKLGMAGTIHRVEVDTAHFKGNFPDSCSVEVCHAEGPGAAIARLGSAKWRQLLPRVPLKANHSHIFRRQLHDVGAATHVRLNIYPDGGVARFRVFGRAAQAADQLAGIARVNQLSRKQAAAALFDCCGSKKWVELVLAHRPFADDCALLDSAEEAFGTLGRKDWLTIFRSHPAIGAKKAAAKQTATAREWSAGEQALAQRAPQETLAVLAAANEAYQATFGHVFLICANEKSSEQILKSLQERLGHDAETEMSIAGEEQRKITRLRLGKLLGS